MGARDQDSFIKPCSACGWCSQDAPEEPVLEHRQAELMDEGKGVTSAKRCKALEATWTSAVPSCCELVWYYTVTVYLRPFLARGLCGCGAFTTERRLLPIALQHSRGPIVTQRGCSFR